MRSIFLSFNMWGLMKGKSLGSPWDFSAPNYDRRDGRFVNAGWNHGSGYKNPVGSLNHIAKGPIPMESKRFEADKTH
jgi:hypothetical protein